MSSASSASRAGGDSAQQLDRVVRGGLPRVGVDSPEDVLRLGVPGPPQVGGQVTQGGQGAGKDGTHRESSNRSHADTLAQFPWIDPTRTRKARSGFPMRTRTTGPALEAYPLPHPWPRRHDVALTTSHAGSGRHRTLLAGLAQVPVIASPAHLEGRRRSRPLKDADAGLDDLEPPRQAAADGSAEERGRVRALGRPSSVRWNGFGTPASISKPRATWARPPPATR